MRNGIVRHYKGFVNYLNRNISMQVPERVLLIDRQTDHSDSSVCLLLLFFYNKIITKESIYI